MLDYVRFAGLFLKAYGNTREFFPISMPSSSLVKSCCEMLYTCFEFEHRMTGRVGRVHMLNEIFRVNCLIQEDIKKELDYIVR